MKELIILLHCTLLFCKAILYIIITDKKREKNCSLIVCVYIYMHVRFGAHSAHEYHLNLYDIS